MYKIDFPRVGFDGKQRSWKEISDWFVATFHAEIRAKLEVLCKTKYPDSSKIERKTIDALLKNDRLKRLLLYSPIQLEKAGRIISAIAPPMKVKEMKGRMVMSDFAKDLLNAFGYDKHRHGKLVELAEKMNLKACPYCNHQYTLFLLRPKSSGKYEKWAKFQYDHFISKDEYPFLSMSFYNLIPSCSVCNQEKSNTSLSVKFNPYINDVGEACSFRLKDKKRASIFSGSILGDYIELELVATSKKGFSQKEITDYDQKFKITAQYARHRDIVQEIADKLYLEPYYNNPDNFTFLSGSMTAKRLLLGVYEDRQDIEKRPMSKFVQDIWEQLH